MKRYLLALLFVVITMVICLLCHVGDYLAGWISCLVWYGTITYPNWEWLKTPYKKI